MSVIRIDTMKKLPIKLLFAVLVFSFFITSCQVKTPKDIIQPDDMRTILYDYHIVQAMGSEMSGVPEYQIKLYYEYIFNKHNITKELFDSSMVWYTRHPAYLTQIYADLQERLDYEVADLQNEKEILQITKKISEDYNVDTLDLWKAKKVLHLTSAPLNNKIRFSFASDTAFVVGDSVALNLKTHFFSRKEALPQKLYVALLLFYADGSTESNAIDISISDKYVLQFKRDYERVLKEVKGFIYYTDQDSLAESGVALSGLSLMRIHPFTDENGKDE